MHTPVRRTLPALFAGAVFACGGGSEMTGPPPEPAPQVGEVRIKRMPINHNLHVGDRHQMEVTVRSTEGDELPDADVDWSIEGFSSHYDPPYASITGNGLVTIETPMNVLLEVTATAGGVSDEELFTPRGWGFEEGTDPISGRPYALANTGANIGAEGPPRLHLRCEDGDLDLYVTVTFVTGSGRVRYRIDDGPERVETWFESSDFDTVFYPGNPEPLVHALAHADTLLFAIHKFGAGEVIATFIPKGLDTFDEALIPPCGS